MPKSTGFKITQRGAHWLLESATQTLQFPTRAAARRQLKAMLADAERQAAGAMLADHPARPTQTVTSPLLNDPPEALLGVPEPPDTTGAQPNTEAQEASSTMSKQTITVGLSGKVHTLLLEGRSTIGRDDPKSPPVTVSDKITGAVSRNRALSEALVTSERSQRSKGYVAKVTLDERLANRLVAILEDMVVELTGVKGGGYDANNCRRYAAQAADRIREVGNTEHAWKFAEAQAA